MSWDFQKLFRRHAAEIARSLRHRGLSHETAADLTQDTFLRVIASPPADGGENHNPRAYLFRVSRNLRINHQQRESLVPFTSLDCPTFPTIVDLLPSPEQVTYSRQCLSKTAQALAELPARTRRAFEMHRMEDYTIAEIGAELDVSTTRAWSLIREAYCHVLDRVGDI